MYLAGKMVDLLCKFVEINERSKQLIQLAGMYHDIGHLSYSHHMFSKNDQKSTLHDIFKMTDHEDRSYFLIKVNQYKKCWIDVDKMNYLHRDHTRFSGFQSDYIIINALIDPDGQEKTHSDVKDLYDTCTKKKHTNVFQHIKRIGKDILLYNETFESHTCLLW